MKNIKDKVKKEEMTQVEHVKIILRSDEQLTKMIKVSTEKEIT